MRKTFSQTGKAAMKNPGRAISLAAMAAVALLAGTRGWEAVGAPSIEPPSLMGTIKDAGGRPMAGVAITAQAADKLFKTTVFTDEHGDYVFPTLLAGHYRVWAQAVGFTTARAESPLAPDRTVREDFTLPPLAQYDQMLSGADWMNSLPEDTFQHRKMKQVLFVTCSGCHGFDIILNNRFNEAGWLRLVKAMESADYNGYRGGDDIPPSQLNWEGFVMRRFEKDLAAYLAEMRGPNPSPFTLKPLPRPTGEAARAVITQYDLPIQDRPNEDAWYHGDDWMKGEASGMHGTVGVHDVVASADGMAWITQSRTTVETNRSLIRLDPRSGEMTVYTLHNPRGQPMYFEQISDKAMGPKGTIWMHGAGALVQLDTLRPDKLFTGFPIPTVFGGTQNSIDGDNIGRAWINGKFGIVGFDPAKLGEKDVMYPGWSHYLQDVVGNGTTYGQAADSKNNPWWSASYSDVVATRDMKTGKITQFPMHDATYDKRKALMSAADLRFFESVGSLTWGGTSGDPTPWSEMPRRLAADKNGTKVWVPNWAASSVAEIDINTHKVIYHEMPFWAHPYKTAVDKNHNAYWSVQAGEGMFKFDAKTRQMAYFPLPTHGCSPRHMSFDDYHNEAWVPCDQADTVDRIQFRSPAQLAAQKAAARVK